MHDVNKLNQSIEITDERKLGFAEYGSPDGKPILFFHGLAGNRFDATFLHTAALLTDIRLISIDRPGIGLSSIDKNRTILSWADDINTLTDHLAIKKFSIIGHSAGASFAAACAYKIPEKINSIGIVAGMAPLDIPEAVASLSQEQRVIKKIINTMPWVANCMMKLTSIMFKNPAMLKKGLKKMPEVDILALQSQETPEIMATRLMETFRQGTFGASQEMQLLFKPWGFKLTDIKLNAPIVIWQGGADKQAPTAHAELYARLLPNARLNLLKDEGHISLLINKSENILRSLNQHSYLDQTDDIPNR